jgi:hypothetical protein
MSTPTKTQEQPAIEAEISGSPKDESNIIDQNAIAVQVLDPIDLTEELEETPIP